MINLKKTLALTLAVAMTVQPVFAGDFGSFDEDAWVDEGLESVFAEDDVFDDEAFDDVSVFADDADDVFGDTFEVESVFAADDVFDDEFENVAAVEDAVFDDTFDDTNVGVVAAPYYFIKYTSTTAEKIFIENYVVGQDDNWDGEIVAGKEYCVWPDDGAVTFRNAPITEDGDRVKRSNKITFGPADTYSVKFGDVTYGSISVIPAYVLTFEQFERVAEENRVDYKYKDKEAVFEWKNDVDEDKETFKSAFFIVKGGASVSFESMSRLDVLEVKEVEKSTYVPTEEVSPNNFTLTMPFANVTVKGHKAEEKFVTWDNDFASLVGGVFVKVNKVKTNVNNLYANEVKVADDGTITAPWWGEDVENGTIWVYSGEVKDEANIISRYDKVGIYVTYADPNNLASLTVSNVTKQISYDKETTLYVTFANGTGDVEIKGKTTTVDPEKVKITLLSDPAEGGYLIADNDAAYKKMKDARYARIQFIYEDGPDAEYFVKAVANKGWKFVAWKNSKGEVISQEPSNGFKLQWNDTYYAVFEKDVTPTATPTATPEVSVTPIVLNKLTTPFVIQLKNCSAKKGIKLRFSGDSKAKAFDIYRNGTLVATVNASESKSRANDAEYVWYDVDANTNNAVYTYTVKAIGDGAEYEDSDMSEAVEIGRVMKPKTNLGAVKNLKVVIPNYETISADFYKVKVNGTVLTNEDGSHKHFKVTKNLKGYGIKITGLPAGTYNVSIRAYKKINGKWYHSSWTKEDTRTIPNK